METSALFRKKPMREKNGVFYFSEPPKNIKPSRDEAPQDPRQWSYWRKANFDFLEKELAHLSKDSVLLDIGSGKSDFLALTEKFNLCAVDFYPYHGVSVVTNIGGELPFKDISADIILLTNVLEHVEEPNVLLSECRRILKPGGILLGTVPFMIQIHQRPYDFYRYTEMNLVYLFEKHGFARAEIIPVSNLYILLFNVCTSFFVRVIKESRFAFLYRILWKIVRIKFALFRKFFENRFSDPDSPLGYLFKAIR